MKWEIQLAINHLKKSAEVNVSQACLNGNLKRVLLKVGEPLPFQFHETHEL
jgi:hypothetical protein